MPSNTELGKQRRSRGETQKIILEFIRDQIAMRGYPPSVREICDAVGLKSTSTVHGHLKRLESKGLLRRDAMKPRAMEILDGMSSGGQDLISVPLLGPVAAGSPIWRKKIGTTKSRFRRSWWGAAIISHWQSAATV